MRPFHARPKFLPGFFSLVPLVGTGLAVAVISRAGWLGHVRDGAQSKRARLAELFTDLVQAGLYLMNFTWPFDDSCLSTRTRDAGPQYTIHDRNAEEAEQLERLQSVIASLSQESESQRVVDLANELVCAFRECRRYIRLFEEGQPACEGEIERSRDRYRVKLNEMTAAVRKLVG